MKYIWTSPKLEEAFTTSPLSKDYYRATYQFNGGCGRVRKIFLDEDIRTGALAVWNGQQYMKLKYGRWVEHTPRRGEA